MTHKYFEVRREVFDKCSDKELKRTRSFAEMRKLFKWSYWIILAVIVFALIAFAVLLITIPGSWYCAIPVVTVFLVSFIAEYHKDKMYNLDQRKKELSEGNELYNQYITAIKKVLMDCGIDNMLKQQKLKCECEARLKAQEKPYNSISSRVFDMLIGVPLGALISSFMYKGIGDAPAVQMVALIMCGLIIICCAKGVKTMIYFSDGYFKDQYLLNVLCELEYHQM